MEIERKFTIKSLPDNLDDFPFHHIEQAYLNVDPVVRVRKEDNEYYMTYKGKGMLAREESNLGLNKDAYYHLRNKADGNIISKKRYLIPLTHPGFKAGFPTPPEDYSLTIELDVFDPPFAPLILAEVEFGSREAAEAFVPPDWFDEDVTYCKEYHNSYLALTVNSAAKVLDKPNLAHC
ncbi:MAG: CYTH domain-containing protein [Lachnospiraceae bacterium]|nr:CYTH domain-containing protein [Lachnospiraceae bacterium]